MQDPSQLYIDGMMNSTSKVLALLATSRPFSSKESKTSMYKDVIGIDVPTILNAYYRRIFIHIVRKELLGSPLADTG